MNAIPTLRAKFVHAGRIAGRTIAYLVWDDGTSGEFTASEFRGRFGINAREVHAGEHLVDPLAIACTRCMAAAGAKCYVLSRCGVTTDRVHPARLEAALTLAEKSEPKPTRNA